MACITPCARDGSLRFFEGGWQCGIRVESNTGLYTFGQRYYDTDLGRWTQMDPVGGTVGNPNSGNPYVYANDEPNMLVDPSGENAFDCAFHGSLNLIEAGSAFLAFIGVLVKSPAAVAFIVAEVGPELLPIAAVGLGILIGALGVYAAYQIAEALIAVRNNCSS